MMNQPIMMITTIPRPKRPRRPRLLGSLSSSIELELSSGGAGVVVVGGAAGCAGGIGENGLAPGADWLGAWANAGAAAARAASVSRTASARNR